MELLFKRSQILQSITYYSTVKYTHDNTHHHRHPPLPTHLPQTHLLPTTTTTTHTCTSTHIPPKLHHHTHWCPCTPTKKKQSNKHTDTDASKHTATQMHPNTQPHWCIQTHTEVNRYKSIVACTTHTFHTRH